MNWKAGGTKGSSRILNGHRESSVTNSDGRHRHGDDDLGSRGALLFAIGQRVSAACTGCALRDRDYACLFVTP